MLDIEIRNLSLYEELITDLEKKRINKAELIKLLCSNLCLRIELEHELNELKRETNELKRQLSVLEEENLKAHELTLNTINDSEKEKLHLTDLHETAVHNLISEHENTINSLKTNHANDIQNLIKEHETVVHNLIFEHQNIKNERKAGRKPIGANKIKGIKRYREEGASIRDIAKAFDVSVGSVHSVLKSSNIN